ncbi:hypothetical protein SLEP1_g46176 [Rubroshorea leprosula]|uniref:Pentatricopeptide repeat-containing protein n=1 Tax=Rubroshorea leprosula TaxID=152421 RepID=A0AAV5LNS5_9ROSI|nr:hypothetical protein SLEP1_g46176 [Rubroshorea leprosula]
MALFARVRTAKPPFLHLRCFSILSPDSNTPLTSVQKTRAALSLLKSEENPDRILEICRAASLTPESHLDRIAFSVAINKLSLANHFQTIDQFLKELRTRRDLQNERFAAHSLILYGQAKMIDQAVFAFDELYNEGLCSSVKSLNALIIACILAGEYGKVNRIFTEFPRKYDITPNLETYNAVIKAFSESGSSSSAYSVVAEMERKGVEPNKTTFGNMLAGFYSEEKYEDVGKVLKMMEERGIPRGLSTYNIRIKGLCKLKKSFEAKALLDGMLSRGMKPNSETYGHLILGFCKEGNLEEAKNMFKSMKKAGCKPDAQCYFTLVYFLCQGGDFETALSFCKESMEKGWVPSFTTMKSLVNGLAGMSKAEEARDLVGQLKQKFSKNADSWTEIENGLPQ